MPGLDPGIHSGTIPPANAVTEWIAGSKSGNDGIDVGAATFALSPRVYAWRRTKPSRGLIGPRLSKSLLASSLEEGAERLNNASQIKNGASRRPARRYTFPNSPYRLPVLPRASRRGQEL